MSHSNNPEVDFLRMLGAWIIASGHGTGWHVQVGFVRIGGAITSDTDVASNSILGVREHRAFNRSRRTLWDVPPAVHEACVLGGRGDKVIDPVPAQDHHHNCRKVDLIAELRAPQSSRH